MKILSLFLIGFILIIGIWVTGAVFQNYYLQGTIIQEKAFNNLESISKSKANLIQEFLDEKKQDAVFLAESKEVKSIFENELIDNIERELRLFKESKDYENVLIISPEGDILWTAEQRDDLGTNLDTGIYNETGLADLYRKVKKDLGVGIFGPVHYEPEGENVIFITSPVFNIDNFTGKRILLGILALEVIGSEISELTTENTGIEDSGEIYIVNRDGEPLTSLIAEERNIKYPKITSEVVGWCFEDYANYYLSRRGDKIKRVPKVGFYNNYENVEVIGSHQYILESGWCVISEANKEKFFEESLQDILGKHSIIILITIFIVFVLGITLCYVLDRGFELKNRRKSK